jgi:hypothetical protein
METSSTKTSTGATGEQPAVAPATERKGGSIPGAVATQGCCGATGSSAGCCGPTATTSGDDQDILSVVRERYGAVAIDVLANNASGCCGSACCGGAADSSITQDLYLADELAGVLIIRCQ